MDISGLTDTLYSNATTSSQSSKASTVSGSLNNLNATASEDELKEAITSFEEYFLEQILKEVKETFTSFGDKDEDSTMSQVTDMCMDMVYEDLSEELVDGIGSSLTQQLYEQMKRNYNIETV